MSGFVVVVESYNGNVREPFDAVGPFPDEGAAASWLESVGYGHVNAGEETWWKNSNGFSGDTAEVVELTAGEDEG